MKKIPALFCVATVLTVMSACSSPPESEVNSTPLVATTPPNGPSVSPTKSPGAVTSPSKDAKDPLASEPGPTKAEVNPDMPAASSAPKAPMPVADPLKKLDLNGRGNIAVEVGKPSTFSEIGGNQSFADLTVESIDTNFKCTDPGALPSINGQYVRLNLSLSVNSNFAESGWPSLAMSAPDFSVWDSSGSRLPDPIGNSNTCEDQKMALPSPVEPGTTEKGTIVLDVAAGSGSASYVIGGFEGSYGWEWAW